MKLAGTKEIKEIDYLSSSKYKISSKIRMEIAGLKSFELIKSIFNPKKTLVIAGTGNNGGDGLVIARYLQLNGYECEILVSKNSNKSSSDYKENLKIINKMGIKIIKECTSAKIKKFDLIVDAFFGVGLNRELDRKAKNIIKKINASNTPVCAIDLPSGLDADTGLIYGGCVNADSTITFDFFKPGLLSDPGCKYSKDVHLVKLPTPIQLSNKLNNFFIEESFFKNFFKQRDKSSNKGTFGHVLVIGGSKNMSGAINLAGLSAYKTGCGLVTLCVPKCISNTLKKKFPESVFIEIPNNVDGLTMDESCFIDEIKQKLMKKPSAIVIGPGMTNRNGLLKLIKDALRYFDCPIILDADALNLISKDLSIIKKCKQQIILTPHPGEMARISQNSIKDIQKNRISIAKEISAITKAITILKGNRTIISSPKGETYINSSGNEGMATGGMGDSLTGIIASFIAQGYNPLEASILGVFVHGKAGDIISEKNTRRGILASEVIDLLPKTISQIEEESKKDIEVNRISNV